MNAQMITTISGGTATIRISGRFDFNDHRAFKDSYDPLLMQPEANTLVMDLAGVEYVDSSALGMLMLLRERALAVGKVVILSKPSHDVMQILDIANFGKLFAIHS
jgi:HptB-dependent secretion and biofilm anti anti-sigma factor